MAAQPLQQLLLGKSPASLTGLKARLDAVGIGLDTIAAGNFVIAADFATLRRPVSSLVTAASAGQRTWHTSHASGRNGLTEVCIGTVGMLVSFGAEIMIDELEMAIPERDR